MTAPVNLLVEGFIDEMVMHRLMTDLHLPLGTTYGKYGKANLVENLSKYNQAAFYYPWVVVVDLDQDAECAPDYVTDILPAPAPQMCLRVAVRAVEAWLLADAERLAAFLDIPRNRVPALPDAEDNPKITLVRLARHPGRYGPPGWKQRPSRSRLCRTHRGICHGPHIPRLASHRRRRTLRQSSTLSGCAATALKSSVDALHPEEL